MEIHLFFNALNSTTEAMTYELLYTEFHFSLVYVNVKGVSLIRR